MLFSESSGNFILGYKKLKLFCLMGETKVKLEKKSSKITPKKWQHISVSLHPKKKLLRIFVDSKCLYPQSSQAKPIFNISLGEKEETGSGDTISQTLNWDTFNLKNWNKQHLVFFENFEGAITSVIFWRRTRGQAEVKEFMRSPLSNVDEL